MQKHILGLINPLSVMNYFYIIRRKKKELKYVETNAPNKVVKLLKINL